MDYSIEKQKDGTVEIQLTVSADEIKTAKQQALKHFQPQIEADGFRKGKAPLSLVEKRVKLDKLVERTLSVTAGNGYEKVLEQEKLAPISRPSVSVPVLDNKTPTEYQEEIQAFWNQTQRSGTSFIIHTFITPEIKLGNWEETLQNLKLKDSDETPQIETAASLSQAKQKAKQPKPTQPQQQPTKQKGEQELEEQIFEALLKEAEFKVADPLVQGETYQILSRQIQRVNQMGIEYEDFLKSQNKTKEEVEKEIAGEAERSLRVRFILSEIAKEKPEQFDEDAKLSDVIDYLKKLSGVG